MNKKLKISIKKSLKGILNSLPMIFSIILLVSLVDILIPSETIKLLFSGGFIDTIIGAGIGSVAAGNPITSYIIGGELLKQGISLVAITAFLVAWVTVGIVQLPAEIVLLGKKFAIVRNISNFVFSIIVAIITVTVVNII
jgi:uncharacterized membrane protein YraQ (UPF0718 family)